MAKIQAYVSDEVAEKINAIVEKRKAEGAREKDVREGANKQVISSQADSLIKISRIWADFFPANTS
ncbi:relaxosome protein TraM, partial [Klebsiella pneumoniae]|uniref:relaxosome protein TraM n=1 Tax=Klebsiella pneumoniae TaxID=573 RepID=UPI001C6FC34E